MFQNMFNYAAFSMPVGWEWIIILLIVLLIFGRKLPEVARGMGKSISEFKKGLKEQNEEQDTKTTDSDTKD